MERKKKTRRRKRWIRFWFLVFWFLVFIWRRWIDLLINGSRWLQRIVFLSRHEPPKRTNSGKNGLISRNVLWDEPNQPSRKQSRWCHWNPQRRRRRRHSPEQKNQDDKESTKEMIWFISHYQKYLYKFKTSQKTNQNQSKATLRCKGQSKLQYGLTKAVLRCKGRKEWPIKWEIPLDE